MCRNCVCTWRKLRYGHATAIGREFAVGLRLESDELVCSVALVIERGEGKLLFEHSERAVEVVKREWLLRAHGCGELAQALGCIGKYGAASKIPQCSVAMRLRP